MFFRKFGEEEERDRGPRNDRVAVGFGWRYAEWQVSSDLDGAVSTRTLARTTSASW